MSALRASATAIETGDSSYAVRIESGGHVFVGDEPVSAGGGGLGPGPFDLLSAALAECTAMTIRWYARQQGWPVERIRVVVDYAKRQFADAPGPVDHFEKTISIEAPGLTDEQRARLLNIAAKCPVQSALEGSPRIITLAAPAGEQVPQQEIAPGELEEQP